MVLLYLITLNYRLFVILSTPFNMLHYIDRYALIVNSSWMSCSCVETISVDQTVAQAFKLRAYQDVIVNIVDPKVSSL